MAGHARYTALLDACVLYPLAMADALMSLATTGLFAAKWTARIEAEWIRALEENRPDLRGRLGYRRDQMREAVPDWEVGERAWTLCARGLALPDPDDVHVLAAALAGHADCIVTANLKDFPSDVTAPLGIEDSPRPVHRRAVGPRPACRRGRLQAHAGALEETSGQRGRLCCRHGAWWTARHGTATA